MTALILHFLSFHNSYNFIFIIFLGRVFKRPTAGIGVHHGTRAITFQPRAPASRTAHAKQPLFLRLMSAFQPF